MKIGMDFTKISMILRKLFIFCSIPTLFTSCSIYTLYKLTLHLDSLFTCSISTLYKLHLLQVCPDCPQTEQTLGRLHLSSLLGFGANVLAPVAGSMLVQLTRLCLTCLQFEQTWWRCLPLFPAKRILVLRGRPACFRQIERLTTTDLMDSETSHSSRWKIG